MALYIRESLDPVECTLNAGGEIVSADICTKDKCYRMILVYRPPHQHAEQDAVMYAELSNLIGERVAVILGDFNCPINWEERTGDDEGRRLLHFADEAFLTQWVMEPTRNENILDLIFTTEDNVVHDVCIEEPLSGSDHNMVSFKLKVPDHTKRVCRHTKLDLRRANLAGLRAGVGEMQVLEGANVQESYDSFCDRFMAQQSLFVPTRLVGDVQRQPKWYTAEIGRAIKERKAAYRRSKANRSNANAAEQYIRLRRRVKSLVVSAKRDEELRVASICKENPKEFFSYVNCRKPVKNKIGPLRDRNGSLTNSDSEIVGILNDHFSSVFTEEVEGVAPVPQLVHGGEPLDNITCTQEMVLERIKKLCTSKSPGPDGFLPKLLKEVAEQVAPHLVAIFNQSLRSGSVPRDWKEANVTPIFKKGDRANPGNYRPISLTSVVGKMLEGIIVDAIVEFLERNKLLLDTQHGFRRHRSCLTNLIDFFHGMLRDYDSSRAIDILYLDFQKAFDKVPHKRLMSKVRALGVQGAVSTWIECWLRDRRQRVVINGESSTWAKVTSGVPQGSVLGPLLFIIYINDIDVGITNRIAKFADDSKLGGSVNTATGIESLRADLRKVGEWSEKWLMPFNLEKCKVMHIGHANQRADYSLLGHNVASTELEKDLGVQISSDLKFSEQCIEAEKKAQRLLGCIRRRFRFRNKDIVLTLYNSLVRPHLEYAVQFWAPTLRKDIQRLERVQSRATKLIPSIRHMGYERRLRALGLFSLETRRLRGQLIEVFKILHGFDNLDHERLFKLNRNATRSNGWKLDLPRYTCNAVGNFFTVKICNTWNKLPADVVDSSTVEQFKTRLDRILHTLV